MAFSAFLFPVYLILGSETAFRIKSSQMFLNATLARSSIFLMVSGQDICRWKGRLKTLESQTAVSKGDCPYQKNYTTARFKAAKAEAVQCIDTSAIHLRNEVKVGGWEFKVQDRSV